MRAVRSVDSLAYGARLALPLLVASLAGGALLAGGAAVGYAELRGALAAEPYNQARLAGGAALALLGALVTIAGAFGTVHKLVADSVAAGLDAGEIGVASPVEASAGTERGGSDEGGERADGDREEPADAGDSTEGTDDPTPDGSPDRPDPLSGAALEPESPETSTEPHGSDTARPEATAGTDGTASLEGAETPRAPSPGEIAFGPEGDADAEDDPEEPTTAEQEVFGDLEEGGDGWEPATDRADDPLADLSEEE